LFHVVKGHRIQMLEQLLPSEEGGMKARLDIEEEKEEEEEEERWNNRLEQEERWNNRLEEEERKESEMDSPEFEVVVVEEKDNCFEALRPLGTHHVE
jgi:hypothetical protein